MKELMKMTALEMARSIAGGELSPVRLAEASINAIEESNEAVNAVITVTYERAINQAKRVEECLEKGEKLSPLAGVPIIVKDNIQVRDIKMTCASRMLENYISAYDATVVEKLESAGLVIVGKANMDEFAIGSTGETSLFGPTRIPGHLEYCSGGSSSGSAAAIAADMAPLTLGTDTGGSARVPASYCGVWGLKPTYGTVSRYGSVAHASSLEQVCPMASNGADLAALLDIISGKDYRDPTSVDLPQKTQGNVSLSDLKFAVPDQFVEGCSQGVYKQISSCIDILRSCGAVVEAVSVPEFKYIMAAYTAISTAEASSNLSRFDGVRYGLPGVGSSFEEQVRNSRGQGFGKEVKRRILLGTYMLNPEQYESRYLKAHVAVRHIKSEIDSLLNKYDLILCPTTIKTAPTIGEAYVASEEEYAFDINTAAANLTGLPALSFPYGVDEKGLPVGMHLMGRAFEDKFIIAVADAISGVKEQ